MIAMDILLLAGLFALLVLTPAPASGQENYETSSELCCNGRVHPRNATNMCCGAVTYDTQYFGCCSERLHRLPVAGGYTYECCYPSPGVRYNSVPFNYRTHKCCQGHVTLMPNANDAGNYYCCGAVVYDARTHLCCGDRVSVRGSDEDCCDGVVYNGSHQACCWGFGSKSLEGRVLDFDGNRTSCCGFKLFDAAENACCGDIVRPLPPGSSAGQRLGCCDDEPYLMPSQFCCITFERRNGTLVKSGFAVHDSSNASTCCGDCCHTHLAHFKPHGTEYNVSASCCDNTIIHPETHECLNGKVHALEVASVLPCGESHYNVDKERCCSGEVLAADGDYQCCYSNDRKYHKVTENCCGNDIVPISAEDRAANKISCCPRF